jgi:hypothetical protein
LTDVLALVQEALELTDALQRDGRLDDLAAALNAVDVDALPLEVSVAYAATTHHPLPARAALVSRIAKRAWAERPDEAEALMAILERTPTMPL